MYLNVTALTPPKYQEAVGRYKVDTMYLSEKTGATGKIKTIHFEQATSGWVISEFESPCQDDVCFFGYQKERGLPPSMGYVYGAPDFQVYYEPMVYDDADTDPTAPRGYHLSVEYTPDPKNPEGLPDLTALNGRYVLQPRYVHEETGKYAIMPVDFKGQRTWVLTGLLGVPRKWRVLMKAPGPNYEMYSPPLTTEGKEGWAPVEDGLRLVQTCSNVFPVAACNAMKTQCGIQSRATQWIRDCCRSTCNVCGISRAACKIQPDAVAFLALDGVQGHISNESAQGQSHRSSSGGKSNRSNSMSPPSQRRTSPARHSLLLRSRRSAGSSSSRSDANVSASSASAQPGGLAGALSDVLAGDNANTDLTASSVWPMEEPDPASGYESPFRRRRTAAPPEIIEREVIKEVPVEIPGEIVEVPVPVPVLVPGGAATPAGGCSCPPAAAVAAGPNVIVNCPLPSCAAQAAAAAAAAQAANMAAQAAMSAASGLPSKEALAANALAGHAVATAGQARDYAMRAHVAAQAAKHAVDQLRTDMTTAAAARAAELTKVQVVPPTFATGFR